MKKTLGGERLGSGKKIKVDLHNWGRSTFNQSRKWRSTMAPGVLVPCFTEIGLNGTTFDIDINTLAHTIPTIGPLFGSFKMQIDMFACPIRLYQGLLHNNMTNIGLNMSKVLLPQITPSQTGATQKSSLLNYLGLKGINSEDIVDFNALTVLMYYDIFKNYYSNKQEENAKIISSNQEDIEVKPTNLEGNGTEIGFEKYTFNRYDFTSQFFLSEANKTTFKITVEKKNLTENATIDFYNTESELIFSAPLKNNGKIIYKKKSANAYQNAIIGTVSKYAEGTSTVIYELYLNKFAGGPEPEDLSFISFENYINKQVIIDFPLKNIDEARKIILKNTDEMYRVKIAERPNITDIDFAPYTINCSWTKNGEMQGLVLKTYQSDMYTNWLNNDNIELINEISAVQVNNDNSFNIDALILAKKVHSMLNRIAVSGGTYEDWQEANYGEKVITRAESPIYIGGASAEIQFDEVVSTAKTEEEPLATLAGKGIVTNRKGGHVIYKCEEPTIIMGIVSITPRVDYAEGNKWFLTQIETMDDFHKPSLDGIGFQNLMADTLHWQATGVLGKQTAWINYQSAVDEVFGNFAKTELEGDNQSYMVLKRQFKINENNEIEDFTSYIDPAQYNYAFADNRLESQNFWVQIGFNVKSRRKMAAYEIPQL